jgi:beta-galactosidase
MGICCCFICVISSIVFAERQGYPAKIISGNSVFSSSYKKVRSSSGSTLYFGCARMPYLVKIDYKRGIGNYEKKLFVQSQWKRETVSF